MEGITEINKEDYIDDCVKIVKELYKVNANPATSKPDPKFALVAGTFTFTFIHSPTLLQFLL